MDLSFGPEYDKFRDEVKRFIAEHLAEHLAEDRRESPGQSGVGSEAGKSWQKLLIKNGYAARTIPKEYGGFGAAPDLLKSRIIAEEFAREQINTGLGGQGISMLTPVLLELGTEEQKQQFIKPTIHGDMIWCQGYSRTWRG